MSRQQKLQRLARTAKDLRADVVDIISGYPSIDDLGDAIDEADLYLREAVRALETASKYEDGEEV